MTQLQYKTVKITPRLNSLLLQPAFLKQETKAVAHELADLVRQKQQAFLEKHEYTLSFLSLDWNSEEVLKGRT